MVPLLGLIKLMTSRCALGHFFLRRSRTSGIILHIFSVFFVNYKVKLISGVVEYIYVHVVIVGYSVSLFYVSLGKYMPRKPY